MTSDAPSEVAGTPDSAEKKSRAKEFVSARESKAHQSLIAWASENQCDANALRRLLWLCNAHPNLVGHLRVFRNIQEMFATEIFSGSNIASASDWKRDLPEWHTLIAKMLAASELLQTLPGLAEFAYRPRSKRDHPILGEGVIRHPLMAALWSRHEHAGAEAGHPHAETAATYLQMQAHLLYMHLEARWRAPNRQDAYESYAGRLEFEPVPIALNNAGRAVREFSHARYGPVVDQFPRCDSTLQFTTMLDAVALNLDVDGPEPPAQSQSYFEFIQQFFFYFPQITGGELRKRRRVTITGGKGGGGAGGGPIRPGFIEVELGLQLQRVPVEADIEDAAETTPIERVRARIEPTPDDDPLPMERSGLAPEEVEDDLLDLYEPDAVQQVFSKIKFQRAAIEIDAQHFHWDIRNLTPHEILLLWKHMDTCFAEWESRKTKNQQLARSRARGGLLLKVMLVLGINREASRLLEMQIASPCSEAKLRQLNSLATECHSLVLEPPTGPESSDGRACCFLVPGLVPRYDTALPVATAALGRPRQPTFALPNSTNLGSQLVAWIRREKRPLQNRTRIFGIEPQIAEQAIGDFLNHFEETGAGQNADRITEARISRWLTSTVQFLTSDQTLAWMVTHDERHRNEARMHYTQYRANTLQEIYAQAIRRLHRQGIGGVGDHSDSWRDTLENSNHRWVGSRFVVRSDVVSGLLAGLLKDLQDPPTPLSRKAIRTYHNRFVLYSWLVQGLCTSVRAIVSPTDLTNSREQSVLIHQRAEPTGASLFCGLSDKDKGFKPRARLVDTEGILADQLDHLERHNSALIQRLAMHWHLAQASANMRQLFVLDEDCSPKPLDIKWSDVALLERGVELPANFNRAFLRTELLSLRCPPQSIDAVLGHANSGESTFGRYSTYDYEEHRDLVKPLLAKLHKQIGLTDQASRLVPDASPNTLVAWPSPFSLSIPPFARNPAVILPEKASAKRSADLEIEAIWETARKQATDDDKLQIEPLRDFLESFDNPHARLFSGCNAKSGQANSVPDASSATKLEDSIIAMHANKKIKAYTAASWLRLLHRVERALISKGHSVHPTRLTAVLRDATSPFTPEATRALPVVELWRHTLWTWCRRAAKSSLPPAEWAALIGFSAVVHGALLDRRKLSLLLESVLGSRKNREFSTSGGYAFFEFDVPLNGAGTQQMQRWFLDTVTELLILRAPTFTGPVNLGALDCPLRNALKDSAMPPVLRPTSWGQVMRFSATWWSSRSSQADVLGAKRTFASHGIKPESWRRIAGVTRWISNIPGNTAPANKVAAEPSMAPEENEAKKDVSEAKAEDLAPIVDTLESDVNTLNPWLANVLEVLATCQEADLHQQLRAARDSHSNTEASWIYLDWALKQVEELQDRGESEKTTAIKRFLGSTVPQLLIALGGTNPATVKDEELAETYVEILATVDPTNASVYIEHGLRSFHAYLRDHHGHDAIDEDEIFDEEDETVQVDAEVLSVDDYLTCLAWLDIQPNPRMDETERHIARLVLTIIFRSGIRPKELFGLRLCDIFLGRGIYFLVRRFAGHGVKTDNAIRMLPMHALLNSAERKVLRDWLSRRLKEENLDADQAKDSEAPLLKPPYGQTKKDFKARIGTLLGQVMNLALVATDLHLYHLRHSFATWTYLKLRVLDYPLAFKLLARAPETVKWLRNGRRLRCHLLGPTIGTDRRCAYAVGRLLGHLSVGTSFASYLHSDDLIRAHIVHARNSDVPRAVLTELSGYSRSSVGVRLLDSPIALLNDTRRRLKWQEDTPSAAVAMPLATFQNATEGWLPSTVVRRILAAFLDSHEEIADIAKRLRMSPDRLQRVIARSRELAEQIDEALITPRFKNAPPAPLPTEGYETPQQRALLENLEERTRALWLRDPDICRAGILLHLGAFQPAEKLLSFSTPDALRSYIAFIENLGIPPEEIQFQIRVRSGEAAELPAWAIAQLGTYRDSSIRSVIAPELQRPASEATRIGIRFVEPTAQALGLKVAQRFLLIGSGL